MSTLNDLGNTQEDCLVLLAEPGEQCELHSVHHPSVAALVAHEVVPLYLRERTPATGAPDNGGTVLVCGTGHDNVHAAIAYLLGEGPPLPVRVGRATWNLAERAVTGYLTRSGAQATSEG